jgi:predicted alpha/beta superfamily hydrolase
VNGAAASAAEGADGGAAEGPVSGLISGLVSGFTLAAFRVNDWNTDLSPWEAAPVFGDAGFGSGAEDTLKYILESLIPELTGYGTSTGTEHNTELYLGGYSLSGFFSLWAAYQTDRFAGVAAVSPSVWFPGWMDFAREHSIRTPRVYLSLGDKEERTRNPVMRTVGDNICSQLELLESDAGCTACTLEMNQGNHFREPDFRTAKGFAWLLSVSTR